MSVTSAGAAAVRIRILLRRYAQDKKAKHPPPPAPRERTQARSAVAPTTTAHAPLPGILEKLDEPIAAYRKEDKDRLEAASSKQPAAIYIRIAREVQRGRAGTCHGASGSSEWIDGRAGQPERRRRGRGRASGIMLQWGTRRSSALRVMVNAEHACR